MEVKEAFVAMHSLIVTFLIFHDPRLPTLSHEHSNILKWSALLHDISKRGPPEFNGCDHTHPFVGAKVVLKIFHRFGFLDRQIPGHKVA
jgi:hypothetical protein